MPRTRPAVASVMSAIRSCTATGSRAPGNGITSTRSRPWRPVAASTVSSTTFRSNTRQSPRCWCASISTRRRYPSSGSNLRAESLPVMVTVAVDLRALEPGGPVPVKGPEHPDLVERVRCRAAHAGVARGRQFIGAGVPVARHPDLSAVISTVLVSRSVIWTLRRCSGAGRHPKVPSGWNLWCRDRAPKCCQGPAAPGSLRGGGRGSWCTHRGASALAGGPRWADLAGRAGVRCGMPGEGAEWAGGAQMWRPAMRSCRHGGGQMPSPLSGGTEDRGR